MDTFKPNFKTPPAASNPMPAGGTQQPNRGHQKPQEKGHHAPQGGWQKNPQKKG